MKPSKQTENSRLHQLYCFTYEENKQQFSCFLAWALKWRMLSPTRPAWLNERQMCLIRHAAGAVNAWFWRAVNIDCCGLGGASGAQRERQLTVTVAVTTAELFLSACTRRKNLLLVSVCVSVCLRRSLTVFKCFKNNAAGVSFKVQGCTHTWIYSTCVCVRETDRMSGWLSLQSLCGGGLVETWGSRERGRRGGRGRGKDGSI